MELRAEKRFVFTFFPLIKTASKIKAETGAKREQRVQLKSRRALTSDWLKKEHVCCDWLKRKINHNRAIKIC